MIDALADDLSDTVLAQKLEALKLGVVGVMAITRLIDQAEDTLKVTRDVVPEAVRMLRGALAIFMYK